MEDRTAVQNLSWWSVYLYQTDWIVHAHAANLISNEIMSPPSTDWIRSLELVGVVNEVYQDFPGATISLSVLEYPLRDAHWARISTATESGTVINGTGEMLDQMGREEAIACVARIFKHRAGRPSRSHGDQF